MPYKIDKENAECKGFAVVNEESGAVEGCHQTEGDAINHLRALYANVPDVVSEATVKGLHDLHKAIHKRAADPDETELLVHHMVVKSLNDKGWPVKGCEDWACLSHVSDWTITVDGAVLDEMGLTSQRDFAKMADTWERNGSLFDIKSAYNTEGEYLIVQPSGRDLRKAQTDTFIPPEGVARNAKRALEWIKDGHAGGGFTNVGRARAKQLANRQPVSLRTIRRMNSYLSRHEVDSQAKGFKNGEDGFPSAGRVAWDAWGGDEGARWAKSISERAEKGIYARDQFDLFAERPILKAEERRFTLGPLYIPNSLDAHAEWTDPEELQQAVWDYVRTGDRRIRLQHNKDVVAGEWLEVMTFPYELEVEVKDPDGTEREVKYPAHTVFMGVQWEPWAWELVKEGKIRGYSIGGKAMRIEADVPEAE